MPGEAARSPLLELVQHGVRKAHFAAEHLLELLFCDIARAQQLGASPASVTTVDSTPTPHAPPSITSGMRPSISARTSRAVVGLGLPDKFAEAPPAARPPRG